MRIRWSPHAVEQAKEIFEYIARDRPEAAEGVLEGLIERVELLREFPEQGRVVSGSEEGDIRSIVHGPHRITYRVRAGEIAILSVRHTRQESEE